MTTAINTLITVPQGAVSVPLTMAINKRAMAATAKDRRTGDMNMCMPVHDRTGDAREQSIMVFDVVVVLNEKSANEFNCPQSTPGGVPYVTANVNGVPHAKRDFTLFMLSTDKLSETEVRLQRLMSKFTFAGVARSGYDAALKGSADEALSIDTHCYWGANVEVEEEIPNFTPVRLFVPRFDENKYVASQDSINRQVFGITPMRSESISVYAQACLRMYVNGGLKGSIYHPDHKDNESGVPISFFTIRDNEMFSDVIISEEASIGHRLALGYVGIVLKGLNGLISSGHLPVGPLNHNPDQKARDDGKTAAGIVIPQLSKMLGLVTDDDGSKSQYLENGFQLMADIMDNEMVNDAADGEVVNICNNSFHIVASTVADIVNQKFKKIGTVFRLGPRSDTSNKQKRMVEGFWSSLN